MNFIKEAELKVSQLSVAPKEEIRSWLPLSPAEIDGALGEALVALPRSSGDSLDFILGKDGDRYIYEQLERMPHLLVAGTTGSGKSVFLNGLLSSLLIRHTPDTLQLGLIDPKKVEFACYQGLPHLEFPVTDNIHRSIEIMEWAVDEMENRLDLMVDARVKSLSDYCALGHNMTRIVIVIDEFADLIMGSDKKDSDRFSKLLTRLAQKARAAGIHAVLSTQKPIGQVVTSLLKGNIPARVAFRVTNELESRVIMDQQGAELLAGKGDMLFQSPYERGAKHMRGVWVPDSDIEKIVRGG